MATIKPTLTVTSNASTATRDAGPLSIALNLSATDTLTVDNVTANHYTTGTSTTKMIDGSALDTTSPAGTADTSGAYIYMKNTDSTNSVMVGYDTDDATDDLSPAGQAERIFTLKAGEFAWFPFDYCGDITVEAIAGTPVIEYWVFDR
tara:strand:+ start:72 stop:515 length:444 start_codon:yes stop_codon:yes gene_type:complete